MGSLHKSLLGMVTTACEADGILKAAEVKDVLKLALSGARQTLRIAGADTEATWLPKKWEKLAETVAEVPSLKSSPALANLCRQIAQVSKGSRAKSGKDAKVKGGLDKKTATGKGEKAALRKAAKNVEGVTEAPSNANSAPGKKRKGAETIDTSVNEEKRKKKKVTV